MSIESLRLQTTDPDLYFATVDRAELEALCDVADVAAGLIVECYWGGCGDCPVCRFNTALDHLYGEEALPGDAHNR